MKLEILSSPKSDGTRDVRGWIASGADGKFQHSDSQFQRQAESFQRFLACDLGRVQPDERGIPKLNGELPSAEETLRYMLTHPQLAGRIRQVA